MTTEFHIAREEVLADIQNMLDRSTILLNQIPEKYQWFNWQNIANLRGAFRNGPNGKPRPIDGFSNVRLQNTIYELDEIHSQMTKWLRHNPTLKNKLV